MKEQEVIWKATKKDLLARVEKLRMEKEEKENENALEIEEVITEVNNIVAKTIWEANIRMVEDLK